MYDNHAHPGFADDNDVDAMASPPDESATLRLRDDNPEFVAGAKALFGYPYDDFKPEHSKWLADRKKAAETQGGTAQYAQRSFCSRAPYPGRHRARVGTFQSWPLRNFRREIIISSGSGRS